MIFNTKFEVGEKVKIIDSNDTGIVKKIQINHNGIDRLDPIQYFYLVVVDGIGTVTTEGHELLKLSQTDLIKDLTNNSDSVENIANSLKDIITMKNKLEESESILKKKLNMNPGDKFENDDLSIACYSKTTHNYKNCKEYQDKEKEMDQVKNYLKLANLSESTSTIITTVRLKNETNS